MEKKKRMLLAISVALGICAVLNVVDNVHVLGVAGFKQTGLVLYIVATCISDVLLMVLLMMHGLRLLHCEQDDTRDLVNTCESLAIASAGLRVADWLVDVLTVDVIHLSSMVFVSVTLAVILGHYVVVKKFERSSFWDGVRVESSSESLLPIGSGTTTLLLDNQTGLLRPARKGEQAHLVIRTEVEHFQSLSGRAQDVMQTAGNVRHCSCVQLGSNAFGNVRVPREVQRAAGFDAGTDIVFAFQVDGNQLVLVTNENDPARSFIATCIVDQFLTKESAIALIPEVSEMLAMRMSQWLRDYQERLLLLEERLSDDVYELPRGFTEFMGDTRRELGVAHGFCKQMGDLLEDLSDVAEKNVFHETSQLCAAVSRQYLRLATDASEVRELAGEVRVGFQERIELRQNNVMSMLTIVTTVFTPLALVTGWYGMNFSNMPELTLSSAYFVVATIMVMLIAAEFAYFKRRRWF